MKKRADHALREVRKICLSLPDTKETITWGEPHFRVGEKIFAGFGQAKGKRELSFKLKMEHAAEIVELPTFTRAAYVGHKGWVSMDVDQVDDWDDVRGMILESYLLIAPKKSVAKLKGDNGDD